MQDSENKTNKPHADIKRKLRAYCAGPMTGYPQYNFPAFDKYRDELSASGYDVVSPADIDRKHGFDAITGTGTLPTAKECALRDITELVGCDLLFLMPGWQDSKGARMELAIAEFLGMQAIPLDKDESARPLFQKFTARCNCELCQETELP